MSEKQKQPLRARIHEVHAQIEGKDQTVPTVGTVNELLNEVASLSKIQKVMRLAFDPGDLPNKEEAKAALFYLSILEIIFLGLGLISSLDLNIAGIDNTKEMAEICFQFAIGYAGFLFLALSIMANQELWKAFKKYLQSKGEVKAITLAFEEYLEDNPRLTDTIFDAATALPIESSQLQQKN